MLQLLPWLIVIVYVVFCEVLDTKSRMETIQKDWPRLWRLINNRPARLVLLMVAIGLLARDFHDATRGAPAIEISGGDFTWDQLRKNPTINLKVDANNGATLVFVLRNMGNSTLVGRLVLFVATPASVKLWDSRVQHFEFHDRPPNVLQLIGLNIPPYSQIKTDFTHSIDVVIPREITEFDLTVRVLGENIPAPVEIKPRFRVIQPENALRRQ